MAEYIQRIAESSLSRILASGKIAIVLGARQVGKTTLVTHFLKGKDRVVSFNFDVETDKLRFLSTGSLSPMDAWSALGRPEYIVLDEVQRLPETSHMLKAWYDTKVPVKIIMLGSSSLDILGKTVESLAGRNFKLKLPPLVFTECLSKETWLPKRIPARSLCETFKPQIKALILARMNWGSYPEVLISECAKELLRNLSSDYLWKDILQTGLVKTPDSIKRLLLMLAHQAGSEVSVNELAKKLCVSRPAVDHYLDLLEQSFVIFRLPAFGTNPRSEVVRSKKIFFWDTGIRNCLLNSFSEDEFRPDIGSLWENWVVAEIAKMNLLNGEEQELFFWRTRAGSEVDLVVRSGCDIRAFEIKWAARPYSGKAFREAYGVQPELVTHEDVSFLLEQ